MPKTIQPPLPPSRDIGFPVSMFLGFLQFSEVSWVEKPLETEMLNY